MCKGLVNVARTAIIVLLLSLFAGSIANAVGTISITSITPSEATSNSLYAIKFTIAEEKGIHPDGDKLYLNIKKSDGKAACTPINIDGLAPSWTKDGNTYTVYMSAGLKMNINAEPASWDASTELWISPTGQRIVYTPALMAKASIDNDDAAAQTFAISLSATWTSGTPPVTTKVESGAAAVTIHDSHTNGYGGAYSDKDFLWGYTGYPEAIDSDPLTTLRCTGESPDDTENPDDGTSSTEFTFKVIYRNSDNLPPVQYLLKDDFRMFSPYISLREKINGKGVDDELTGVVLYIGMQGGEYYALPMQKANPADNDYRSGVTYQYVLKPEARNGYRALPNGVYKYFFACSDDTILDPNGRPYTWLEARPFELGSFSERNRHKYPQRGNIYSLDNYVDRSTYQPGVTIPYAYPADRHPVITLGLDPVTWFFDPGVPYIGTMSPYKRAVDPILDAKRPKNDDSSTADTNGVTASTPLDFEIMYSQLYGKAPDAPDVNGEISVWINDNDGPCDTCPYRKYTLIRDTAYSDVRSGVRYHLPTAITLSPGPHSYYFTASDGNRHVRYPVNVAYVGSTSTEYHHYFNGPYVNHKAVLSESSVTPASGTVGQNYRYSVKYTDADNQRPYYAHVIIQDDSGNLKEVQMTKLDLNDNDYTDGVVYIFDSANLPVALSGSSRKYCFDFVDDWGAPSDANDRITGENVYLPDRISAGDRTWITGPYIETSSTPTLASGSVISADGSCNDTSLWTYKITYTDASNTLPKYIKVYVGKRSADGLTTTWDSGHDMAEATAGQLVYPLGKDYIYTTHLAGSEAGISYCYRFETSNGVYNAAPYSGDGPSLVKLSTPPALAEGGVTPLSGSTKDSYRFAVVYKDTNGVAGRAPSYIRVKIDGTTGEASHDMKPVSDYIQDYKNGVTYYYQPDEAMPGAVMAIGDHSYYFEASNGSGYACFDKNGSHTSAVFDDTVAGIPVSPTIACTNHGWVSAGINITRYQLTFTSGVLSGNAYTIAKYDNSNYTITLADGSDLTGLSTGDAFQIKGIEPDPILGPWVNDSPTLTNPSVQPNLTTGIGRTQPVAYSVTYKEPGNNAPEGGYPAVYIDSPAVIKDADVYNVAATGCNQSTITADTENWGKDQFKDSRLRVTSGPASGKTYDIESNTEATITLKGTINLAADGFQIGDKFRIGYEVTNIVGNGDHATPVVITDDAQSSWPDNIVGRRVQFSGASFNLGKTYAVLAADSAAGRLTLESNATEDAVADGVVKGDKFVIANAVTGIDSIGNMIATDATLDKSFKGIPIQFTSGNQRGHCYTILSNTENTITLTGTGIDLSTVSAGDTFSIGKLFMHKQDITNNNYAGDNGVVYTCSVPSLDANSGLTANCHTSYFKAFAKQVVSEDPSGKFITADAWADRAENNPGPTMVQAISVKNGTVSPIHGFNDTIFSFSATYSNIYGEAPAYMQVIIDGDKTHPVPMFPSVTPADYRSDVPCTGTVAGLSPGMHTYYFEAADSGNTGRLPLDASGYFNDLVVLHDPALTMPAVTPGSGDPTTAFTYSVTYTDEDNLPFDSIDLVIDGTVVDTSKYVLSDDSNAYNIGRKYTFVLNKGYFGNTAGNHTYGFSVTGPSDKDLQNPKVIESSGTGPNTTVYIPPVLTKGSVTPTAGPATIFDFSVTYQNTVGVFGTPPAYVKLILDGEDIPMSTSPDNTNFTQGVVYQAGVYIADGEHSYYFTASDGAGYAVFDANGSHAGVSPITAVSIPGPFVNNAPELFEPAISPNPAAGISPDAQVTYTVKYKESNGKAPEGGYPVVYVDTVPAAIYNVAATSCSVSSITVSGAAWVKDQFKGMRLCITSGKATGKQTGYSVEGNTSDTIQLAETSNIVADGFAAGDTFRVGPEVTAVAGDTVTDRSLNLTKDYTGAAVQFSGHAIDKSYIVAVSSATTLTLAAPDGSSVDLPSDGVEVGDKINFVHAIKSITTNTITVDVSPDWAIPWTENMWRGMPLQITSGNLIGRSLTIQSNTADTLTLYSGQTTAGLAEGDTFNIGKLQMSLVPAATYDYKTGVGYRYTVLGLTPTQNGDTHAAFFQSLTRQVTSDDGSGGKGTSDAWVVTQVLSGPKIIVPTPVGEVAPVLENWSVNPSVILSANDIDFTVTYKSAMNFPPAAHDLVGGYIQLTLDGFPYNMSPSVPGPYDYIAGVSYTCRVSPPASGWSEGAHTYHFTASDGFKTTKTTDLMLNVNHKPVLTVPNVTPSAGQCSNSYAYSIIYTDFDDNPVAGGCPKLSINGSEVESSKYRLTYSGSCKTGITYTYTLDPGYFATAGVQTYKFEASDSYEEAQPKTGTGPTIGHSVPKLTQAQVSPDRSIAEGEFTYAVTYQDDDDNKPAYVKISIDGAAAVSMTESGSPDYDKGVIYTYGPVKLSGQATPHTFKITADNGYNTADTGDIYLPIVRSETAPNLLAPSVTEPSGYTSDTYTYSVTYQDDDNDAAKFVNVYIDGDTPDCVHEMTKGSGTDYKRGVKYTLQRSGLSEGSHTYKFETSDGWKTTVSSTYNGPVVTQKPSPTLSGVTITPTIGKDFDKYTYTVTYKSELGEVPQPVQVYIDGNDDQHAHTMTKTSGTDYTKGVTYSYTTGGLVGGVQHTYWFKATVGENSVRLPAVDPYNGPSVDESLKAGISISYAPDFPSVGNQSTINAVLTGSYGSSIPGPVMIKLNMTSPTGVATTYSLMAVKESDGRSWIASKSNFLFNEKGEWKISGTWDGNADYALTNSKDKLINVLAYPKLLVSGDEIQMVSLPSWPLDPSDPHTEFGLTPDVPFSLAAWLPASGAYSIWTNVAGSASSPDFPLLVPGRGMWMKTQGDTQVVPPGNVVDPKVDFGPITLRPGWNMVGNPYMQFITWSKLKIAYNGQKVSIATASDDSHKWIKSYGWVWEKNPSTQAWQYSLVNSRLHNNTILAFQACWIMASVECDLYMATPATNMSQQSSSIAAVAPKSAPQSGEWMVRIGADNGNLRDDFNYLGVNLSKPEVIQSPVYPSRHVDLYFSMPDGSGRYAYDLRTGGNPGEAWTFYVETDTPGDITLTWDNIPAVPEGTKLVLTDDSAGISQDMVAGGVYTFRLDSAGRRRFRIVAGKM